MYCFSLDRARILGPPGGPEPNFCLPILKLRLEIASSFDLAILPFWTYLGSQDGSKIFPNP